MRFTVVAVAILGTGCETDLDHTPLGFEATHLVSTGSEFGVLGRRDIAVIGADGQVRATGAVAGRRRAWLVPDGSGLGRVGGSDNADLILERFDRDLESLVEVRLADFDLLRHSVYFNGDEYLALLRGNSDFLASRFDVTGEAIESHRVDLGEIRTNFPRLVWNGSGYYVILAWNGLWLLELDAEAVPVGEPRQVLDPRVIRGFSPLPPQVIWTGDEIVGVFEADSDATVWFFRLDPTTGEVFTNELTNVADYASNTLQAADHGFVVATFASSEILRLDPDGAILARERVVGPGLYPTVWGLAQTPTGLAILYSDYDRKVGRRTSHFYIADPS